MSAVLIQDGMTQEDLRPEGFLRDESLRSIAGIVTEDETESKG